MLGSAHLVITREGIHSSFAGVLRGWMQLGMAVLGILE